MSLLTVSKLPFGTFGSTRANQGVRFYSTLPGHVSIKGFPVMCPLRVSKLPFGTFGSTRPNPCPNFLSLPKLLGSTPSCPVMSLLRVSKLPFGTSGSTRVSLPHLLQPSKLPGHVSIYSSLMAALKLLTQPQRWSDCIEPAAACSKTKCKTFLLQGVGGTWTLALLLYNCQLKVNWLIFGRPNVMSKD